MENRLIVAAFYILSNGFDMIVEIACQDKKEYNSLPDYITFNGARCRKTCRAEVGKPYNVAPEMPGETLSRLAAGPEKGIMYSRALYVGRLSG